MHSKHSSAVYFSLLVVVAFAYGETRQEIFGNGGKDLEDKAHIKFSSSSDTEVDKRYYNQGTLGNSETDYDYNEYNDYISSGSNDIPSSGTYFSGSSRPDYIPDGSNSGGNGVHPEPGTTVAFSAIRANTHAYSANSQQVYFDRIITNVGYGWNPNESYFECYYPGTYVFSWSAVSPSNSETRISLYENGQETGHHIWADTNGYQSASETAVLNLNRGARVELKLTEGRLYEPSNSGRGYMTFSGFKLN